MLGLAALVEACPYSVPEWLPEVLVEVASHNHDPAPIQVHIKIVYVSMLATQNPLNIELDILCRLNATLKFT